MSRLLTIGVLQQARNLMQAGGLVAIAIDHTTAVDPCNSITSPSTVYCQHSSLSQAFTNDAPIYADASGNFVAASGWYSDTTDQWFYWDSNKTAWGDDVLCGGSQLIPFNVMGPLRNPCFHNDTYFMIYIDDVGNFGVPMTGAFVYYDDNGTMPLDEGAYAWEDIGNNERYWFEVGNNGEITSHGKC